MTENSAELADGPENRYLLPGRIGDLDADCGEASKLHSPDGPLAPRVECGRYPGESFVSVR